MYLGTTLERLFLDAANGCYEFEKGLPDELKIYEKDIKMDLLQIQLQMLPGLIKTYNQNQHNITIKEVTLISTLCDVIRFNDTISVSKTMLSEVFKLLRIFLTIPVTTATAERTFSTLRRLKNYLRSTMGQQRLNNMMLLHIHKDLTDDIDNIKIAQEFVNANERRMNYFGTFNNIIL